MRRPRKERRRKSGRSIDASLERWSRVLTRLVFANLLKASPGCRSGNTPRHLRLIKRRTDRCAAASPLLNVSHLSPSFFHLRDETKRDDASSSTEENTAALRVLRGHSSPTWKSRSHCRKIREDLPHSGDCYAKLHGNLRDSIERALARLAEMRDYVDLCRAIPFKRRISRKGTTLVALRTLTTGAPSWEINMVDADYFYSVSKPNGLSASDTCLNRKR